MAATDTHLQTAPHSSHYKALKIEPLTFIEENGLNFHEGNVVKYVATWRNKNDGISALRKAKWYLERLIELAEREGFRAQYDTSEATPGADVKAAQPSANGAAQ